MFESSQASFSEMLLFYRRLQKFREVPGGIGSMRSPSCEVWGSQAKSAKPGEPNPTFTRILPHIHQSSGEGALGMWVAWNVSKKSYTRRARDRPGSAFSKFTQMFDFELNNLHILGHIGLNIQSQGALWAAKTAPQNLNEQGELPQQHPQQRAEEGEHPPKNIYPHHQNNYMHLFFFFRELIF